MSKLDTATPGGAMSSEALFNREKKANSLWRKFCRNRAAVIAGASSVNHYLYWVPVVTIAAGMTLLGETMSFVGLMGAAMILCGVWSSETGMKRVSAVLSGADPEKLSARISF